MFKDGINEIEIESYDELIQIIQGKDKKYKNDLREDYIFRGISNVEYELIPSALRKNNLNQLEIDELIEPNHEFYIEIDETEAKNNNLTYHKYEYLFENKCITSFDKYGNHISNKNTEYKSPKNKLQREKEYYILQMFYKIADKCGLKINTNTMSRELIHPPLSLPLETYEISNAYPEIMSLAQHYGLPTTALDWSYDYKVSLYFAVKDIVTKPNNSDCALWALNYKLFENQKPNEKYYINLDFYRPEYHTNPNLNAQKGLFTYLSEYVENYKSPLNEIISNELKLSLKDRSKGKIYEKEIITVPPNLTSKDTIFYKFIIPKEIKPHILKELYLDGYSEEYLFPGYDGVTQSIINRIKLNKLLNETKISKKNILLKVDWDMDKVNKEKLYEFVECNFDCEIDKIFICQDNKVLGYFIGNEIIKDSPQNLWDKYGQYSGLSESELKDSISSAIRINDLHLFKYQIKLHDFELINDFCYIEENENLKFLLNFS